MKVQLSIFATLALSAAAQDPALNIDAYGTPLAILASSEEAYDQNQNHAGGVAPTVTNAGSSLNIVGNRWSAYPFPAGPLDVYEDTVLEFTFTLTQETDAGFNAVCLDADKELTGPNGQCFVLSTTQGWINDMINVAQMTPVGGTSSISIPVGHFFTGSVNYISFLQDSDGTDRSLGNSTVSDIVLVRRDRNKLAVEINGQMEYLENDQLGYKSNNNYNQDTSDFLWAISEDGTSVQINDNQWKALPLNAPYIISHYTVLEFDIIVSDPAEFHSVCLDDDLENKDGDNRCMTFHHPDNSYFLLTTEVPADEQRRLVIPYGQILGLKEGETKVANYLVFIQDQDANGKRGGQMSAGDIRIYEEDRTPLVMNVFGTPTPVPNIQVSFTNSNSNSYVQDSIDHVQSVSADGSKLTAYGNSWKRFKLDTPIDVTDNTVIKFHFEAPVEAEASILCLLDDSINAKDGRNDCFALSGKEIGSSNDSFKVIQPQTGNGEANDYEIVLGSWFNGQVLYLGFGQDNDKAFTATRTEGESSISNIEFYNLPSLKVAVDGGSLSQTRIASSSDFEIASGGNQESYESSSQDNTPVRDNLAVISPDGTSITAHANMWRAFPITPAIPATDLGDFVVSFDYVHTEEAEIHAICFEDNKELGDSDNPTRNEYDPKRCVILNVYQNIGKVEPWFYGYEPALGETHRYVLNLSKFPFERFYEWKYLVIVQDNDVDKSKGEMTISNLHITTSLTSCLEGTDYSFQVNDCTKENFLEGVKSQMGACPHDDPLLELMALFDAKTEMDVYDKIEHICASSYEPFQYDFANTISSESQLVKEFIDGGTIYNYETDALGGNLLKDAAGIAAADAMSTSHLFAMPKHHALDHCDVGAAMCCWVDSRGASDLVDNTDLCYVNMKASKRTAHVAAGYSIYGEGDEGAVNCHGFAWGTDGGSIDNALKGNALFKVGFMDGLYGGSKGNVEQVPGAPMCGCVDRMPVVTKAACTKPLFDTATVDVSYTAATGSFGAVFTPGTISYTDCGDLNTYYKSVVGTAQASYIDSRLVGEGQCTAAINDFLSGQGLIKTTA
jgi:hypothetical protein